MRKQYRRPKKRNQDYAALGWLLAGAVGFLYLAGRATQTDAPPQPQYVGPPREAVDRIATAQKQSMWCWAAAIETILHSYGVIVSQEQIVARIYGSVVNEPASDVAISASLNGWALDRFGRKVVVRSRVATGPPPVDVLMNEVAHQRSILVTLNSAEATVGHAVVITGARHFGRCVTSLIFRDPWPSPENCASLGRVEISAAGVTQFLASVRSHWLISVSLA